MYNALHTAVYFISYTWHNWEKKKKKGKVEFQNCCSSYELMKGNLLPAQGGHHWYLCPARPGLAPACILAAQAGNNKVKI